ncbi:MAG: DUF2169 domain-containing protein [Planctomycetota bacterium]
MDVFNQTPFTFAPVPGRMNFPGHSLTLVVKGTFHLVPGGVLSPVEEGEFPTGDTPYEDDDEGTGSPRYEFDYAYYKPKADLLLVGDCHVPGDDPLPQCPVTFAVGDQSRDLVVVGDRHWTAVGATPVFSDPKPFRRMPIRYEQAFGGVGFAPNPCGRGYRKEETDGGKRLRLPNVENPQSMIASPGSHPAPAGFAPLSKLWEYRTEKTGTYKGSWKTERWPWFPEDFDWSYFNAAPPEMQADEYLRGDEEIYLENLHPKHRELHSKLPGLRVRCFVEDHGALDEAREVDMVLDTVWVDAENEKVSLLWRGHTTIESAKHEEVSRIFIFSEDLSASTTLAERRERCVAILNEYEDEWDEEPEALSDDAPEESEDDGEEEPDQDDLQGQVDAMSAAAGIDPVSPRPLTEEEEKIRDEVLAEIGSFDPPSEEDEEDDEPLTRESLESGVREGRSFAGEDLTKLDLSGLDLSGGEFEGAKFVGTSATEVNFTEAKLIGADFTDADLQGAKFVESQMSRARFTRAQLAGSLLIEADATEASFENADLTGAILDEAVLESANLQRAKLNAASARGGYWGAANLSEATLESAILDACDLSASVLDSTNFQSASLREASVEGARGEDANFTQADLTELRASEGTTLPRATFSEAKAKESIWSTADLTESDFSFGVIEGADFEKATLTGANLFGADGRFAKFIETDLSEAKMIQMNLFRGSLEQAKLHGADLSGSNLYGAELLDTDFGDCRLDGCNLKMTKRG